MQVTKLQLSGRGISSYQISLPINGKSKKLIARFRYNVRGRFWSITVNNPVTNADILTNMPLMVANKRNIYLSFNRPTGYLGIGFGYLIPKTKEVGFTPDIDYLFDNYELHWVTEG